MVPADQSDCSCAHFRITNRGAETEYSLGADIAVASRTHLLRILPDGVPNKVPIPAGHTLDLYRHKMVLVHEWNNNDT